MSIRKRLSDAIRPVLEVLERRDLFAMPHADPGGPYTVNEGSTQVITGTASTGGSLTYQWDLNYDGVTFHPILSGSSFSFKPSDGNATRHMALKVTNVSGSDVSAFDVTIQDVAPTINVSGSGTGTEGNAYAITWTKSDPGSDTISSWRVDWGDGGGVEVLGASASGASHSFATAGSYTVTVSAVDEDGTHAASGHAVTITHILPIVTATGNSTVNEGSNYQVNFSATDAGGTAVALWAIDWGDGSSDVFDGSATSALHAYDDNGSYVITATAVSEDGDSGSDTVNLTVHNVAPTPTISGAPGGSIGEGTAVNLTGTRTDPGANDTVTYAWAVTKNGSTYDSGTGSSFSFTPDDNGVYIATLTATDNDGDDDSVSTSSITVTNVNPVASIGSAPVGHVNEGSAVNLTASSTDDGSADTRTYGWSVTKNGSAYDSGTGSSFGFTPNDNGTYVVTLTATDDDNGSGTDTLTVIADNVAPDNAAISGAPANSDEGTPITLGASATDVGSADTIVYSWTVTKGGNAYTMGVGPSFDFTPDDNGAYVVTMTATDDDGDTDTDSASITVNNVAPAAVSISGAPATSAEGSPITLGAHATDAGSLDTVSYAWAVTKGGNAFDTGNGSAYTFTPDDNGTYIVTLTATDNDGDDTSVTRTITVTNATPVPTITGTPGGTVAEGSTVTLTGSATDAGSTDTFSYSWVVTKNGNAYDSDTGATYEFVPSDNGAYVVTLTVTDNDGAHASTNTGTITVTNVNPVASIGGAPVGHVNEGSAVNLTASATDDGADTQSYSWTVTRSGHSFATGTGSSFSFTPDDNGSYVVTVTATDDDGGTDTDTITVVADNVAPANAAIAGAPANSNEGTPITLSGSATDVGSADEITFTWVVTKGGNAYASGSGSSYIFTPDDNGAYVVTLTATDDDGDTDTDTASITVDNVAPAAVSISGAPATSTEGAEITLGAHATDASSLDTVSYAWAVTKDGNAFDTGNGSAYSFTPDDNGTYVVTLTATDNDGDDTSVARTITVNNVAPTPTITGTPGGTVAEGSTVTLTGSATDAGANDTFSYSWVVTKNGNAYDSDTGATYEFVPTDNGAYVVTLTVTDNDGSHASTNTGTITVTNVNPVASIGGAPVGHVNEGSAVNLTASATDDGADTQSYSWTVTRNGHSFATGSGSSFSFTPDDNGTYSVTVTATDDDGGTDTDTITVTADNVAPDNAAISNAPANSNEGAAITLSGSATDAGSADEITYTWTVTKNGGAFVTGSGSSFSFTPNDNGAYVVTLTATDDDGDTDTDTASITVNNVAPANVTISDAPQTSPEGTQIELSGSATDAGSADTVSYDWAVTKDGNSFSTGTGANFTFTPDDNASYIVTLTATDDDNATTSTTSTISVTNVAPVPTITGTPGGSVDEGSTVSLTASSTDVGSTDTVSYAWNVTRNGSSFDTGTGSSFEFTPTDNGSYIVTLTATDNDGGHASTSSTVTVANVDPVATIGGTPVGHVNEGSAVNLTASATDAGSEDTKTFTWSVTKNGDAFTTGSGSSFSFTPNDNGTYIVTLTATDDDNGSDTDTITVVADNVAPTSAAITGAPANSNEGSAITLSGSATDAGSADEITYTWAVTKNGGAYTTGSGSSFNFTPDDNGTYVVTLTATDDDGDADTDTASITVDNVAPTNAAINNAPTTSPEGSLISLSATADDAGSADSIVYSWSVTKNGNAFSTGNGANFSFTPDDNASYVVSVTATDDDGDFDTDVRTIAVTNVAPVPTISGSPVGSVTEGTGVTLTASATDVGANDTFSYAWTVTKNGSAFDTGTGTSYNFTPDDNGAYIVTLTATDNDGGHASATSTVTVTNANPVATIGSAPVGHVNEGAAVNLTASATDAGTADTRTFTWAVTKNGDAFDSGSGSSFSFTPDDNGTYIVTLTATDDDGGTGTDTATVTVDNVAPNGTAISGAPSTAVEGDDITVIGNAGDDGTADEIGYTWTVTKNGNAFTTGSGQSFIFTPNDNGTYVVTLTATDDDNGTGTDTATITVSNFAPLVGITGAPSSSPEGTAISLGSEVIDPSTVDTFSYAWSVTKNGNAYGSTGSTDSYSFTPTDNGVYIVSLTVTDDDNGATTATRTITVSNVAPTGSIGNAPQSAVNEGTGLSFTSTTNDVGSADTIASYLWSVTKDGHAFTLPGNAIVNGSTFSFTPTDNGSYVVSLAVTDDDGGIANLSTDAILVDNAAPTVSVSGEPVGTIAEGATIALTGTASDPGALDTLSYQWTVTKNGHAYDLSGSSTASTLSFVPSDNGAYVATLKVTDKDGTFTTATSSEIVVTNAAPIANVTGEPQVSPNEGSAITLGITATDPGSDDTFTYSWSVTRNNEEYLLPGETNLHGTAFSFTPTDDGTYVITVRVTDNDDAFVDASSDPITVVNVAPVASLEGPTTGSEGTELTLTAGGTDVGADVLSFAWTVTRGEDVVASGAGEEITFTPSDNGTYVVTVTAMDGDDGSDTATQTIVVSNVKPTGAIEGTLTGHTEGSLIELTASGTDPGQADAELSLSWVVMKGDSEVASGTGSEISFTPADNGTYVVTLTTADKDEATDTTSVTINVTNVAPEAAITGVPDTSDEGSEVSLDSDVNDEGTLDTFTYVWSVRKNGSLVNLGEDAITDESSFSFTPVDDGTYTIRLVVTDKDGDSVTTESDLVVENVDPIATLDGPEQILRGTTAHFSGEWEDAGANDTQTITWSFGDGATQVFAGSSDSATEINHTYNTPGEYTVTYTVTDKDGGSVTAEQVIVVSAAMLSDDPNDSEKQALFINGSNGTDNIVLRPSEGGSIEVLINGESQGFFTFSGGIYINAFGGDDSISVSAGITTNAVIDAGTGNDSVSGGAGDDTITGGAGDDEIRGGAGNDSLAGNSGIDRIIGGDGNDAIDGGTENDILYGQGGVDSIHGAAGKDRVYGGDGDDVINGDDGDDSLFGENGKDKVMGDAGNDSLDGAAGADNLQGGIGNDEIYGGAGADKLYGQAGNDILTGGADADRIDGGDGTDMALKDAGDSYPNTESIVKTITKKPSKKTTAASLTIKKK